MQGPAMVLKMSHFLPVALLLAYVGVCVHVALRARSYGRRPIVWFFITFFCTAIPATIVFWKDQYERLGEGIRGRVPPSVDEEDDEDIAAASQSDDQLVRCPHCGEPVPVDDLDRSAGLAACPRCGLIINEEHTA